MCTLTQIILPETIFLLFVVPGNIYYQLNRVKESILPLNLLGQNMVPVKGLLGASEAQERLVCVCSSATGYGDECLRDHTLGMSSPSPFSPSC